MEQLPNTGWMPIGGKKTASEEMGCIVLSSRRNYRVETKA